MADFSRFGPPGPPQALPLLYIVRYFGPVYHLAFITCYVDMFGVPSLEISKFPCCTADFAHFGPSGPPQALPLLYIARYLDLAYLLDLIDS
jgi:hypothetical protein